MKKTIAIIISDFNLDITQRMLDFALKRAKRIGLEVKDIVHVPGAFEIPLFMKKYIEKSNVDGIVVLGAVIQGSTDHDKVVAYECARKVMDLSLSDNMPVGFGLIGPRVKTDEAKSKAEEYATRAVETLSLVIESFKKFR